MTISRIELELVLVRHGQTKWNAEHRYLGHTDLPLLPKAVEQLSELKQWLDRLTETTGNDKQETDKQEIDRQQCGTDVSDKQESCKQVCYWQKSDDSRLYMQHSGTGDCEGLGLDGSKLSGVFWRVFCSDLLRCQETLAYIDSTLAKEAVYDQRLREMNFGAWEGCTYDQLKDNPQYRSWIDDPATVTPPEGESWAQFEERLLNFLSDLGQAAEAAFGHGANENEGEYANQLATQAPTHAPIHDPTYVPKTHAPLERVLVVTHGGVIRKLLAQIVPGVTFYSAVAPSPGTAMVLKLLWRDGQWSADISEA